MNFRVKNHRFAPVARGIMRGPQRVGRYGDAGSDIMGIVAAASPWNAIISGNEAKTAQANAQLQAVAIGQQGALAQQQLATAGNVQIAKYAAYGIGGFALVVLIASILKGRG